MNGIMNETQLTNVKEYEFSRPLIHKTDFLIDHCIRHCFNKFFHIFDHISEYDIKLTNVTIIERFNKTISDRNMNLNEINKKLTVFRQNGFMFNRTNKFKMELTSN